MLQIESLRARIYGDRARPVTKIGLAPIAEKHNNAAAKVVLENLFDIARKAWTAGHVKREHRARIRQLRKDMERAATLHWNMEAYAREVVQEAEDVFRALARCENASFSDRRKAFAYFVCACELTRHMPTVRPTFGIVGVYVMAPPERLTRFVNECLLALQDQKTA